MQTALGHGIQQADGFHGHRFTAGIGTGNDHGIKLFSQLHRNGHCRFFRQQGVPGIHQTHGLGRQFRLHTAHLIAQLCFGENQVQLGQNHVIRVDFRPMGRTIGRQFHENPVNFRFLLGPQFPQLIVGFHRGHGLHKQRCPGGRHVMDQAGHLAPMLRFHRHHIPFGTGGDNRFLQCLGIGRGRDNLLQAFPRPGGSGANLPANGGQLRTGRIGNFVLRQNRGGNFLFQKFIGLQAGKQRVNHRVLLHGPVIFSVSPQASGAGEHLCNGQQLQGIQHTAQIRPAQRGPHILNAVKRRAALQHHHMSRGAGFFQPTAHLPPLAAGAQIPRRLLCRIADSLRRQHFQYPGQLHRPQ